MYDVIVIGAGPAGSTAAKILAENGLRVMLAEKHKMPRYKSCSGQLIQKTLHLVQQHFGEAVPLSAACTPVENRGMVLHDGKGNRFVFEQSGLNVWRSAFDCWLAEKAAACGAEIREQTSAVCCADSGADVTVTFRHHGKTDTERAAYVIDCEGAVSAVKRKLTGSPAPCIITYQVYHQGRTDLDDRYFYAFLLPELSEYDAWFNVKDGRPLLGVAVRDHRQIQPYYQRFIRYMTAHHGLQIEKQLKADQWIMPKISPGCPVLYGVGRVLFAGETAGFLNPMGEGISAAIEGGFCAAKSITDHFNDTEQIYAQYQNDARALHDYMKRQWNFIGRMSDAFSEMRRG